MRISTKGRYALEAMTLLALRSTNQSVSLGSLAREAGISDGYLEQLFIALRRKGLIRSIQGAQGGYLLTRPASEITAGDVLRAVEGPLAPVRCLAGEHCAREKKCITRLVWRDMSQTIDTVVDGVTLEALARRYQNTLDAPAWDFSI